MPELPATSPGRLTFGHPDLEPDRLLLADNLDVLAGIPDSSLDLVYVDPPFGTGRARRGRDRLAYADREPDPESYLAWIEPRLAAFHRVLLPSGSLFVHLDWRASHHVKVALDRLFGAGLFVNEIVWCYSVGGKGRRCFARKHDTILWYARSQDWTFLADAVRVPRKAGSHMRVEADESGRPVQVKRDRRTGRFYRYPVHLGKIPEDYWTDIETLNRGDAERVGWPTQKPEALVERILLATTRPGALVGDFFCGSGTTAVVAQRHDRRFLAVDSEPEAIATTVSRLRAAGAALAASGRAVRDVIVDRI